MEVEVEIVIRGTRIPVTSEAKFREIGEQLSGYWRFLAYLESLQGKPSDTPNKPQERPISHKRIDAPVEAQSSSRVRRSWPERAWGELNRPSTAEEIYDKAVKMGFVSTANSPIGAFKRAIRENPVFVRSGTTANGGTLWVVDEDRVIKPPVALEAETKRPPGYGFSVPPGQRTVDYAERALEAAGRGLRTAELAEAMVSDGWVSMSSTVEKRNRSVAVALYTSKGKVVKNGEFWELKEWSNSPPAAPDLFDAAGGKDFGS